MIFLDIFFMNDSKVYFGLLTSWHVSIVVVATSHAIAPYGETEKSLPAQTAVMWVQCLLHHNFFNKCVSIYQFAIYYFCIIQNQQK